MHYKYVIDLDERGQFQAHVEDHGGKTVWEVSYPEYYQDDETGEEMENSTIFDDGYMSDTDDVEGLEKYLKQVGIMPEEAELKSEDEFEEEDDDEEEFAEGGYNPAQEIIDSIYGSAGKVYRVVADIGDDKVGMTAYYTKAVIEDVIKEITDKGYKIINVEEKDDSYMEGGEITEYQGTKAFTVNFKTYRNFPAAWRVIFFWGGTKPFVEVTKVTNNPFGGRLGTDFDTLDKAIAHYKSPEMKVLLMQAADVAKKAGVPMDMFAYGGEVKWQNADTGDSALVKAENKMGVIMKAYGRKFHLKFVDGTEKTYDANDLTFFEDEEMAKGGMAKVDRKYTHFAVGKNDGKIVTGWEYKGLDNDEIKNYTKMDLGDMDLKYSDYRIVTAKKLKSEGIDPFSWDNWRKTEQMAKGGVIGSSPTKEGIEKVIGKYYYSSSISLHQRGDTNEYDVHNAKGKVNGVKVVEKKGRYQFVEDKEKMADGGQSKNPRLSLFLKKFSDKYKQNEDNNMHSENVVLLAERYGGKDDVRDARTILAKHNAIGKLTPELEQERSALNKKLYPRYQEELKEAKDKGYLGGGGKTDGGMADGKNKMYYLGGGKMKSFKDMTFREKSASIQAKLKGSKVSPKYQKLYGKTYDSKEAKQAADAITGKIVSKMKE